MIEVSSNDFDIKQIANSGQCFRFSEINPGIWEVVAFGKSLKIYAPDYCSDHTKNPINPNKNHFLDCSEEEYKQIWRKYFDMQYDYGSIKQEIRKINDPYLTNAVNFGYGIRILNQDLWETIVSFIISQQNNIPRIKNIIKNLCAPYSFNFPTAHELAQYSEKDLVNLGLGYRAPYIKDIALAVDNGQLNFKELQQMSYKNATNYLKQFNGIGDKVANCIVLFGLHKLDAFPIDVWINKILQKYYDGKFDIGRFPGYAGIVQQYMFYYERSIMNK